MTRIYLTGLLLLSATAMGWAAVSVAMSVDLSIFIPILRVLAVAAMALIALGLVLLAWVVATNGVLGGTEPRRRR